MHCGGMEAFLLRLGTYLRQHGCHIELITTIEPGEWFGRLADLQITGHHIPGYSSGLLGPWQHSLRVSSFIAARKYDLLFLNHTSHAQAALARLPQPVIAIPILHNDAEEIYRVGCGNQNAWNVAVAVSPKVARRARERVPQRPVQEITSGVDLPTPVQWQQRRPFGRPFELLFIGRLDHAQKGILWLPDIYRTCLERGIEANLTIVGSGPDVEELRRKLRQYRLEDRTRLLGSLSPEQVYGLLLQSHVLLMPSNFEGLPIALLESLACGCVPVVSRLPGITDSAVHDSETGLLAEVGRAEGYAEAIVTLYNDAARWSRMSRAAHESAEQRFSMEAMGQSYSRLITDALQGRYPLPLPRKDQPGFDPRVFSWRDFLPSPVRRLGRRGRAWMKSWSPAQAP
jgi:glycosyltransferase involved in cell wall biosynthesis